jgi:hypothetical protein
MRRPPEGEKPPVTSHPSRILKIETAAPSVFLIQHIDAEEETAMRLRKLRIRSLFWFALSALVLVLAGVFLCLEVLGTGHFLAAFSL